MWQGGMNGEYKDDEPMNDDSPLQNFRQEVSLTARYSLVPMIRRAYGASHAFGTQFSIPHSQLFLTPSPL
jgi:hypothetical protein